jgi:hypothetical protein
MQVNGLVMLMTYRSNSRLVGTGLGVVTILTFREFCRRRSSDESSDGNCGLHVDDNPVSLEV